ncbi:MAG TPA: LPXTG cell wall anchor domain-containing protein [Baekduia sp.]|nr:LPXTG cell wall anchor domain-containing protein [Baekduia sp.]
MRIKTFILALVATMSVAVPAFAQDSNSGYTSTTPTTGYTTTTPTVTETTSSAAPDADNQAVAPSEDSGAAPAAAGQPSALANTGSDAWVLFAIGGALALGAAALLVRERRPHRNR